MPWSDSPGSSKNDTITKTRRPALRTRTHSTPLRWKRSATARAATSRALIASAFGFASTRSLMLSRRMSNPRELRPLLLAHPPHPESEDHGDDKLAAE
jgi:hypothetical protein